LAQAVVLQLVRQVAPAVHQYLMLQVLAQALEELLQLAVVAVQQLQIVGFLVVLVAVQAQVQPLTRKFLDQESLDKAIQEVKTTRTVLAIQI
jgi:hypothetical protein